MTTRILTMPDVIKLSAIVECAIHGKTVAWLYNDNLIYGIARSIGDPFGNFLRNTVDVRDGYLRISTLIAGEQFLPLSQVMRMYDEGEFVIDPHRPDKVE
jgi:hypothetical protein